MESGGVDRKCDRRTGPRVGTRIDPRAELTPLDDHRELLALVGGGRDRLLGLHGRSVDREQDVHFRAELLRDVGLHLDRGKGLVLPHIVVLEVGGADAEDDLSPVVASER